MTKRERAIFRTMLAKIERLSSVDHALNFTVSDFEYLGNLADYLEKKCDAATGPTFTMKCDQARNTIAFLRKIGTYGVSEEKLKEIIDAAH